MLSLAAFTPQIGVSVIPPDPSNFHKAAPPIGVDAGILWRKARQIWPETKQSVVFCILALRAGTG
jgi:hypothetical protein